MMPSWKASMAACASDGTVVSMAGGLFMKEARLSRLPRARRYITNACGQTTGHPLVEQTWRCIPVQRFQGQLQQHRMLPLLIADL